MAEKVLMNNEHFLGHE